ncbi:RNA polymerase sigma factor (sigma-70 family) [Marmoricola sp. OAE513]|uniref:RNA polymerase sigma factor n=1 Tax=Marmoricola sp. OAE513 TaxID=2817894 RepID=UPI001AE66710
MHPGPSSHPTATDQELSEQARAGDAEAYAELWRRHEDSARAFAITLAGHAHAQDLVSDAFARVWSAMSRGGGPTQAFRAYLIMTIRHAHVDLIRRDSGTTPVGDLEALDRADHAPGPDERVVESAVMEKALKSLPERWQTVLWLSTVEDASHDQISELLGIKPNAVAALAFRAREGLRHAYFREMEYDHEPEKRSSVRGLVILPLAAFASLSPDALGRYVDSLPLLSPRPPQGWSSGATVGAGVAVTATVAAVAALALGLGGPGTDFQAPARPTRAAPTAAVTAPPVTTPPVTTPPRATARTTSTPTSASAAALRTDGPVRLARPVPVSISGTASRWTHLEFPIKGAAGAVQVRVEVTGAGATFVHREPSAGGWRCRGVRQHVVCSSHVVPPAEVTRFALDVAPDARPVLVEVRVRRTGEKRWSSARTTEVASSTTPDGRLGRERNHDQEGNG